MNTYEVLEAAKAARIAKQAQLEVRPCAPHVANSTPSLSIAERMKSEIFEIEKRTDLTTEEKIAQITHITCVTCAGIAVQPIPFADIFILTPIQAYMGSRIAAIRGVPVSESEASVIIKEILGVIGLGFAAQQIALGIWKTLMPGAGGLMTIPLVYGLSFAIMRVMDAYFVAKAANRKLSDLEIKSLWQQARSNGENFANRSEVVQVQKIEEAASQCATIQKRDDRSYSTSKLTIAQMCANGRRIRLLNAHKNEGTTLLSRIESYVTESVESVKLGLEYRNHLIDTRKAADKAGLIAALEAEAAAELEAKIAALK